MGHEGIDRSKYFEQVLSFLKNPFQSQNELFSGLAMISVLEYDFDLDDWGWLDWKMADLNFSGVELMLQMIPF